jgi:Lon protease-like protein
MAKACLREGTPFGVCLIREGREVGAPAVPAEVGCTARIASWDMPQLGVLHVVALGEQRFRLVDRRVQRDGLVRGSVELLAQDEDAPVPSPCLRCARLVERVVAEHPDLLEPPYRFDSSAWVSARLTELLPLPVALKQELLELRSGTERLERLNGLLGAGES